MTTSKRKIVCVHLLNDYSGSPRVLSQVVQSLIQEGFLVDILTSNKRGKGFLSDIIGVGYHHFFYQWNKNKLLTLLLFFVSQVVLFFKVFRYRRDDVTIYVNTALPFGAALSGKLLGKRVIYHMHETSIRPVLLKRFLFYVIQKTASDVIYVSKFLSNQEPISGVNKHVVYNTLTNDFIKISKKYHPSTNEHFNVLMLCSLKAYKGVMEFVELARALKQLHFEMVINAKQPEIDDFFRLSELPENLRIYPSQSDVHPFYQRAHLVLNLSHPLQWVETFGLTALEAMSYGIPVIVPPVGGIAEVVEDGKSGYQIDVRNTTLLKKRIIELAQDRSLYELFSKNARARSVQFSPLKMASDLVSILYH